MSVDSSNVERVSVKTIIRVRYNITETIRIEIRRARFFIQFRLFEKNINILPFSSGTVQNTRERTNSDVKSKPTTAVSVPWESKMYLLSAYYRFMFSSFDFFFLLYNKLLH